MKILYAASECVPFIKTGGLADIAGTLPRTLCGMDADVRVILPKYRDIGLQYKEAMKHLFYFYVNLGWRRQYVGIETLTHDGVTFYFVDNEYYFGRNGVYGFGNDEGERFGYFCRAVLEALPLLEFVPDVIHCHDWQTGLIPALLKTQYQNIEAYQPVQTVFTIHNLQYQGVFPWELASDMFGIGTQYFSPDSMEYFGCLSFMKAGLTFADRLTTVSPTYASEIKTRFYGEKLEGVISKRAGALTGILNGIDTDDFNPETDDKITANFSADNLAPRALCKEALQKEMGLNVESGRPIIAMVTRLVEQKGLDLIEFVFDDIMRHDIQLVFLGSGDEKHQNFLSWANWKYPGKIGTFIGYNDGLARRIYAGSDMFLMPSLFEPCGLSQMVAMRYGSVPIVRETGGLRDTIEAYNQFSGEGTGFSFKNYDAFEMLHTIENAINVYYNKKEAWAHLIQFGMRQNNSWQRSANEYVKLYKDMLGIAEQKTAAPEINKTNKTSNQETEDKKQETNGGSGSSAAPKSPPKEVGKPAAAKTKVVKPAPVKEV